MELGLGAPNGIISVLRGFLPLLEPSYFGSIDWFFCCINRTVFSNSGSISTCSSRPRREYLTPSAAAIAYRDLPGKHL